MTGKAKPKKHTAKELAAKLDAATTNRGGGKAGLADRSGQDKGGHAKLECPLCKHRRRHLQAQARHSRQLEEVNFLLQLLSTKGSQFCYNIVLMIGGSDN
ncbi:unnamed protein product [Fraxinus pennsylvanica]|uniref:Uncharacterized protein n=1 Tax=Fraxinus pennsylvanica TaxID=56036 RepID=A0AAD1ZQJ7_9LAMI|nr:unnamed protein product [Fraxinus pennsylvanica]